MIALGLGVIHAVKNNGVLSRIDRKPKKTKNTEKGEEKVEPEPKWLASK